jgi:alkaline phosphatase D
MNRTGTYPLYDITCSPLTSGTHALSAAEKNNPFRVFGLTGKQNYTRFTISGSKGQRKLTTYFLGVKGEPLGEWSVMETELKSGDGR